MKKYNEIDKSNLINKDDKNLKKNLNDPKKINKSQSRTTTPIKTTKRSSSVRKSDNNINNSSQSKPRLSRCLSNTSSKRDLLLKSIKREDLKDNDIMESIDTSHFNTKKVPVNLSSEENVKHLMHKREDLLNNIQNIELELETAIKNMPNLKNNVSKDSRVGGDDFPSEFKNVFKDRFEHVNDEIKNKLIMWMQEINFIKENSLTPEMLSQVMQNG